MGQAGLPADPVRDLPFAHGGPVLQGLLRARPEDFVVEELLGYGPSGEGEHVWIRLRKRRRNTLDVAQALARLAGVPVSAVGFAGLKDREALTTQHFTVQLPGRADPDWSLLQDADLELLEVRRHNRKIRRGSLRGNRFRLRVEQVLGDRDLAGARLQRIAEAGVPNYFGEQRFGRGGENLPRAARLLSGQARVKGREQRGLLLSAARAHLFNQVLAARVAAGVWDTPLEGDVLQLAGSERQFMFDPDAADLAPRIAQLDVHPSGPLCGGAGHALEPALDALALEQAVLADWPEWISGLARLGLEADRRPLRLAAGALAWEWRDGGLELGFELPAGAYATALARELLHPSG
jgi:tRNA pseudouridine13 synthase